MGNIQGLDEYSKKLKKNRVAVNDKYVEIRELNTEKIELWDKLLKDFKDNKSYFKKQDGLSGLDTVKVDEILEDDDMGLFIYFSNNPTATGLSIIESETGLTFYKMGGGIYIFKLI